MEPVRVSSFKPIRLAIPNQAVAGFQTLQRLFYLRAPPFGTEHGCGYFLSSDACVEAMIAPFRFSEKSNA